MRRQQLGDPRLVVRVLEDGVGEELDHVLVERHERVGLLDLEPVLALEVDRVHRAGARDLLEQIARPRRLGVELEAQVRVAIQALAHGGELRRVAEAERVDEPHRTRRAPERVPDRRSRLPQREVQGRRLVGPVAPVAGEVPRRLLGPLLDPGQVRAEAAERPLARQRQLGRGAALGQVRRDVLAEAGLAAALQAHEVGAPIAPECGLVPAGAAARSRRRRGEARLALPTRG